MSTRQLGIPWRVTHLTVDADLSTGSPRIFFFLPQATSSAWLVPPSAGGLTDMELGNSDSELLLYLFRQKGWMLLGSDDRISMCRWCCIRESFESLDVSATIDLRCCLDPLGSHLRHRFWWNNPVVQIAGLTVPNAICFCVNLSWIASQPAGYSTR